MQVYIVGNWHAEAVKEFEEVYITYDGWLEYESIGFWLCNGFTLAIDHNAKFATQSNTTAILNTLNSTEQSTVRHALYKRIHVETATINGMMRRVRDEGSIIPLTLKRDS